MPLPGLGFYSASSACLLALCILGEAPIAVFAGLFGLLLRTVRFGPSGVVLDAACLLASALVAGLSAGFSGQQQLLAAGRSLLIVGSYLLCYQLLLPVFGKRLPREEYLPWLRLQRVAQEMRLLVGLAGLGLGQATNPWALFALLPCWGTHRAVAYGIFRLHAAQATQAITQLETLHREQDQSRRELQATRHEKDLLEELTRQLSQKTELGGAVEYFLDVCQRFGRFDSLAVLSPRLEAYAYRGGKGERLQNAELLGLREPLLQQGLQQPQLLWQDDPQRIFAGEPHALAVPLDGFGVLYAGREKLALTSEECRRLLWLAGRAAPILATLRDRHEQGQDLERTRRQSEFLAGQVSVLSQLLAVARTLAGSLELPRILELGEECVRHVLPADSGSLWLRPATPERAWGEPLPGQAAEMVGAVVRSGRPLMVSLPGFPSALAVPLNPHAGAILLASRTADAFQRAQQDTLCLLGTNLGLALANASHLQNLVQSSKMTAVGQLAAGLAHELNTPLAAIRLALEAVSSTTESAAAKKKLERATRAAERSQKIVEKLLVYTRLSSPIKEPVDLKELVEDTVEFFQTGLELELELKESLVVWGMAQELQQVLINLLLNAQEAYPEAEPKRISIRGWREGELILLAVRDYAAGMSAEEAARACEPFFTTKIIGKNTGLGLAVSLEIMRQHGGDMHIRSVQGEGTTVVLTLPSNLSEGQRTTQ